MKNLDAVLKEKEEQVETLQKEIEALRFVAVILKEEAAAAAAETSAKAGLGSSLASAPAPTHVMQGSSSATSFEREPGYLGSASGLKQFP